jgi:allantoinase
MPDWMRPMKLPVHNRYDYVPINRRNDYTWPGGKRLAVYFCNMG